MFWKFPLAFSGLPSFSGLKVVIGKVMVDQLYLLRGEEETLCHFVNQFL